MHVMVRVVMTSILGLQLFYRSALCSSGILDESQLLQPTVAHSSYLHVAGRWGEPKEVRVRSARRCQCGDILSHGISGTNVSKALRHNASQEGDI